MMMSVYPNVYVVYYYTTTLTVPHPTGSNFLLDSLESSLGRWVGPRQKPAAANPNLIAIVIAREHNEKKNSLSLTDCVCVCVYTCAESVLFSCKQREREREILKDYIFRWRCGIVPVNAAAALVFGKYGKSRVHYALLCKRGNYYVFLWDSRN